MSPDPDRSPDPDLRQDLSDYLDEVGADEARRTLEALEMGLRGPGDLAGRTLGDFDLHALLGRGGMGEVYEATQRSVPGRRVAVKVLERSLAPSLRRFAREVEVIGRLDHPHVVPVLAADLGHETPHFAMKLVEGRTLAAHIAHDTIAQDRGARDFGTIARWCRELAEALEHAHRHGVVHRDVNPRNVLIDQGGGAMLLDFGLARDERASQDLTDSGDAVGTPHTMAPEQVDPRRGPVGPLTDVYGLGATLYQALTGRPPFHEATRHATLSRILEGEVRPPRSIDPRIPADLQTVCLEAIQRRPGDRYASAHDFGEDLRAFLEYRPIRAAPPPLVRRLAWFARRNSRTLLPILAVALGLVSAIVYQSWIVPAREIERLLGEAEALPANDPARAAALQRALEIDPEDDRTRSAMAAMLLEELELQLRTLRPAALFDAPEVRALEDRVRRYFTGRETPELLAKGFRQVPAGLALLGVSAAAIEEFQRRTASTRPTAPIPDRIPGDFDPRLQPVITGVPVQISPRQVRLALISALSEDELVRLMGPLRDGFNRGDAASLLAAITHGLGEPGWTANPRRLLLDLGLNQIQTFLLALNRREATREDDGPRFLFRLPTPEEWEYAARGADGRRHPWGDVHRWEYSQNHRSTTDEHQDHRPDRWPEEDRSPFGLRDLAGSLQEPVMPTDAPDQVGLKRIPLRGGSRFSRYEEELRAWRSDYQGVDEHRFTTGLRLAAVPLRELPACTEDRSFSDDFEDGASPGWQIHAFHEVPVGRPERSAVEEGRLQIEGYHGHFSPRVVAVHPVELPSGRGTIRLRLRSTAEVGGNREACMIVFGEYWQWADLGLAERLSISRIGQVSLPRLTGRSLGWPAATWTDVTIELQADGRTQVRLRPSDGSHPEVVVEWRRRPTPVRYVGIGTGKLWGFRVEVEEIEVRPAE